MGSYENLAIKEIANLMLRQQHLQRAMSTHERTMDLERRKIQALDRLSNDDHVRRVLTRDQAREQARHDAAAKAMKDLGMYIDTPGQNQYNPNVLGVQTKQDKAGFEVDMDIVRDVQSRMNKPQPVETGLSLIDTIVNGPARWLSGKIEKVYATYVRGGDESRVGKVFGQQWKTFKSNINKCFE